VASSEPKRACKKELHSCAIIRLWVFGEKDAVEGDLLSAYGKLILIVLTGLVAFGIVR
jgi:hypothetical protein